MRNKKLERALYGPTLLEISIGLILSVLLGAVLAVFFLILKPVEQVAEMPKVDEIKRGQVYYLPGALDYSKAKQWMGKRQRLAEIVPGEIVFTEDDLNAWSTGGQPPAPEPAPAGKPGAGGKKPAPNAQPAPAPKQDEAQPAQAPASDSIITPSVLNFRVREGNLQVALPTTINLLGYTFPVVAQARGGFQKQGDMYVFVPKEVMIGSLPLHRFPGAIERLVSEVYGSGRLPESFLAPWRRATSVAVDGDVLRITLQ
jgi:hypothetical protein